MYVLHHEENSRRRTYPNRKSYIFINQAMSWSSAQQYCRENYKDLAMIENQEENMEAQNAIPSGSMGWIGLYREPWTWSDGTIKTFQIIINLFKFAYENGFLD
uniref:C-type lectin domain-containing protein n=1 Tax=Oryzias melastigma TaxID=30732 RepID=A0A3B3DZ09_ORYME